MPRRRRAKIYWRKHGGARHASGDFRAYARWGGKRSPLIPRRNKGNNGVHPTFEWVVSIPLISQSGWSGPGCRKLDMLQINEPSILLRRNLVIRNKEGTDRAKRADR